MSAHASSFTKLRYDPCTYGVDVHQSLGPGQYVLDVPRSHCKECLPVDSRWQAGTAGDARCSSEGLIDVESELYNIRRKATGCPAGQYLPGKGDCRTQHMVDSCSTTRHDMLPTVDTRLNNPPCTLRGTGWNRWEWLCQDPQQRALLPFDAMINTAIVTKDNHRPSLPCPLDATQALPVRHANQPAAMSGQPAWAGNVMLCHTANPPTVGNGIGADGAAPAISFRACQDVATIANGPGAV